MALIQSVVLAGAGNLGSFFLEELTKSDFAVTVLSRPSSTSTFPPSVTVKHVDYSDETALIEAVKGADAVISTLSALDSQANLVRAAKKAGIKLFVPSEFGNPTSKLGPKDHPALYGKTQAQELLKQLELPSIFVFSGPFLDWIFNPTARSALVGKGETPISFTARRDIARFLIHHLSSLSSLPSPSSPTVLRIEGDRSTFKGAAELYQRLHPDSKLSYTHTSLEQADEAAKNVEGDFMGSLIAYLRASWERGATVDEGEGEKVLSNAEWPEWKPLKLEEYFRSL
ncbi:hypothetical protein JCM8097_005723 [Rhodosporidiobolus ruineniae]